ncbi:ribbon-helix-helix protein, CopG family [Oceanibaculum nanhaiense]|uniref:ribbon-helix-helix protein, CopG family n=1 Tax=Oceanibaculum nanhaiense TaxID=1909734 RepID=UPI003D2D7E9E
MRPPTSIRLSPKALRDLDVLCREMNASRSAAVEWLITGQCKARVRPSKATVSRSAEKAAVTHEALVLIRAVGTALGQPAIDDELRDTLHTVSKAALRLITEVNESGKKASARTLDLDLGQQPSPPDGLVARILRRLWS